ncbi:hypothetical protein TNCV_2963701 [Trichonephila clavipes]|nr:hypothetical protein TNCV_2963701 [Trichonephila clavipes]
MGISVAKYYQRSYLTFDGLSATSCKLLVLEDRLDNGSCIPELPKLRLLDKLTVSLERHFCTLYGDKLDEDTCFSIPLSKHFQASAV